MKPVALMLALALLLPCPLPAQEDEDIPSWMPPKWPKAGPVLEKSQAKPLIKEFELAIKKAQSVEEKFKALERLRLSGSSDEFVAPLVKLLKKEKHPVVLTRIVENLGVLRSRKASKALLSILKNPKHEDEMDLLLTAGRALGACTTRSQVRALGKNFRRGGSHVRRGIIMVWAGTKDWGAIKLLGEWIERPRPGNVNSPSNPPASWWRQRHREWRQIQRQVEWGLWEITGQVFYTKKEVREFLKKNPRPPKKKKKQKQQAL